MTQPRPHDAATTARVDEPHETAAPGSRAVRVLRAVAVVVAVMIVVVIGVVAAVAIFTGVGVVLPHAIAMYAAAIVGGIAVAVLLSFAILSGTRRRRRSSDPWAKRALVSIVAGSVTGAVLVAASVAFAIPVQSPSGRPQGVDGTHYAELASGSRVAWWKTPAAAAEPLTPVVFLHGGPGGAVSTAGGTMPLFDKLSAEGRDVYYFDQVGAGLSELLPADEYSIERLLADLDDFVTEVVRTDRVILLGHSFGGFLAEAYASAHPDTVEKIVLVTPLNYTLPEGMTVEEALEIERPTRPGGAPTPPEPLPLAPLAMAKFAASSALAAVSEPAAEAFLPQEEQLCIMAALMGSTKGAPISTTANLRVHETSEAVADEVMAGIERTEIPTLVIRNEYDYVLWPSLRMYRDLNPAAQMVYLPGLGHSDIGVEDVAVLTPIIAFLKGLPLDGVYTGEGDPHFVLGAAEEE